MPQTQTCPGCGASLPADGWQGLCPQCLIRVSLQNSAAPVTETEIEDQKSNAENPAARRFGDYELLEEIARGGMGVVYRARQVSLNRTVAVKMILAGQLAGPADVQRFRGEAEAAANLNHPNIVAIHEIGQQDGQHFFSMDYVEGQNLAEFVGQKPLPPGQAAKYLKVIAEAIHYAHQQGILHRDLKPSNILIDQSDQPRVTDFGLAKQLKSDSDLTLSGQVLGSPNFMPPEQAAGRRGQAGPQSDVYAMGAILFYLLTSRPPFVGESMTETLQLVVNTEPPSPRLLAPGVPRDLETICLKCLSKEPGRRYKNAQELADELGRFLKAEPVLARPVGATEKAWRWCRRNPVVASFAGATAVLLLAVAIGSPIAALRINRARQLAQSNAAESHARLVRQYVANGNRLVDEGDLLGALPWFGKALKEEQDPASAEIHRVRLGTTLQQCPELAMVWFPKAFVSWAQFSPDGGRVVAVSHDGLARVWDVRSGQLVASPFEQGGELVFADFSPDGEWVAICSASGTVGVWSVKTGRLLFPLRQGGGIKMVQFSPDGRRLVTAGPVGAQLWEATTGRKLGGDLVGGSWAAFSPDGRRILTSGGDAVRLLDGMTGQPLSDPLSYSPPQHSPDFGPDRIGRGPQFSPDGSRFALPCGNGTARVCDASSGKDILVVHHRGIVRQARFSPPAGRWLVTASHDATAQVWDATTGVPISPPLRHDGPVVDASFSPDGRFVVTASSDTTVRVWDAASGREVAVLRHAGTAGLASFSPDGQQILTVSDDETVRVWNWRGPGNAYVSVKQPAVVRRAAFSPDCRRVGSVSIDGTFLLWDPATGQPWTSLGRSFKGVRTFEFSPDSRLLAVADTNGTVRVLDLVTGQPGSVVFCHGNPLNHLEFSPDGKEFITTGNDGVARAWEVASGRMVSEMRHRESVNYASFTPDGKQVVTICLSVPESFQSGELRTFDPVDRQAITAAWGEARLRDVNTGLPLTTPQKLGLFVSFAAFSPDRLKVLATCSARGLTDKGARLADLSIGQCLLLPLGHAKGLIHGSFSPNGKYIVTTSWDHTARVWDAGDGRPIGPPLRHKTYVYYAEFSPDSRLVVTASADHTARVWDAISGEPVTPPLKHAAAVNRASFSPDTEWVLTTSADGEVRAWWLSRATGSVEDKVQLAQLLAGQRIDDTDAVLPLTAETMQSAWTAVRTMETGEGRTPKPALPVLTEGDYFAPGEDTEAQAWSAAYSATSVLAMRLLDQGPTSNDCVQVIESSSKAIEAEPDAQHGGLYFLRARAYEDIGDYQRAVNDLREWLWRIGPIPNKPFLVRQCVMLGRCYSKLGQTEKAEAYLQEAEKRSSEDAVTSSDLARSYVTGPTNFYSPAKALPLALRAVELAKTDHNALNTLGEVYYRLGQFTNAVRLLEMGVKANKEGGSAQDFFCLAMAYQRLGDSARANDYLARALKWMGAQPPLSLQDQDELASFRAEAEGVLGKPKKE